MTTTITIAAHVSKEKVVKMKITDRGEFVDGLVIQDGETVERHIYDDREISVKEVDAKEVEVS